MYCVTHYYYYLIIFLFVQHNFFYSYMNKIAPNLSIDTDKYSLFLFNSILSFVTQQVITQLDILLLCPISSACSCSNY